MRISTVFIAMSMVAWVATADVAHAPKPQADASGVSHTNVILPESTHPKVKAVGDEIATDANALDTAPAPAPAVDASPSATGEPIESVEIAGAGPAPEITADGPAPAPLAPTGPVTPAEEKADAVLACMRGCSGVATCQNACIDKGYNIPSAPPVPAASPSAVPSPTPLAPGATGSTANPTTSSTTSGQANGVAQNQWHATVAVAVLVLSTLFVSL
ncbi:hypothetical protein BGZ94_000408 [Podila epigama]|nr:hypothetical protein BGZ94_000408 [Podila epigama]